MPIRGKTRNLLSRNSLQLFEVEALPKAHHARPFRKTSIPFTPSAVKILRYFENLPMGVPYHITQNGVVGKLFSSYLEDVDLVSILNTRSEALEGMTASLSVLIPIGKDISDRHIAAICDILLSMFVAKILHLYEVLQKKPHGGISQNQIINALFSRAEIEELITRDAMIKSLQRERERTHREAFAIYSVC